MASIARLGIAMPAAKRLRARGKISALAMALLFEIGREDSSLNQRVYLVTLSHVLVDARVDKGLRDVQTLTRKEVLAMIRDAVNNPVASTLGGRPRTTDAERIEKAYVFQEQHADGSKHFHIALKFFNRLRFNLVKQTLRDRYKVASHWSCRHTQLCSETWCFRPFFHGYIR